MPALLLFIVAAMAVYILSQGVTGISADAPCHCGTETGECGVKLTYNQIYQLAVNAGFGQDSGTAAAIALAESSGNPTAYNKEPQDVPGRYQRESVDDGLGSYGLWQIYLAAHAELSGVDLTDPQNNANAAFSVYSEAGGFHPWSTFKSGAYQAYLNA